MDHANNKHPNMTFLQPTALDLAAPEQAEISAQTLPPAFVDFYKDNGFVRVRGLLAREEALRLGRAATAFASSGESFSGNAIFQQLVNVWPRDEAIRELVLNPRVGQIAQKLAGAPLRLWHDQLLIKAPHNGAATEFHQDQPYWPHANSANPISMWIALCDVPVERGCMTFIPGSHRRTDLRAQNLASASSLFDICPDLAWEARATIPLRAGDCTFHHGRCAHMATPNTTDQARVAHVVIWMDASTVFSGAPHIITQPLNLQEGQPLDGELFPRVLS